MKLTLILVAVLYSFSGLAAEQLISRGQGYDKEKKEQKFTYERYREVKGDEVHDRAIYKDMSGEVLTEEKLIEKNGQLVRYDIDQKQIKQKAWIEVADGKVTYNLKKFRKRNYPITDKLKENFMVGLQMVDFIKAHWDDLMAGKKVDFNLGVWHRQETIGFRFSKESAEKGELVVKMNPTSMFIRAVVDPLYFHFDQKTKVLTQYVGRTTPKEQRGRDYYDFDGLVTYEPIGEVKAEAESAPAKKTDSKKN